MTWSFWLELWVRSGFFLLLGQVLYGASHAARPAFRHRLLSVLFLLLTALPLLCALAPEIPISPWRFKREPMSSVAITQGQYRTLQAPVEPSVNWPVTIWLIGCAAACVPVAIGSMAVSNLARRASALQNPALQTLATQLAGEVHVLISEPLQIPVACGFLRPRILLPASAEVWSSSRLEAVLLHELAHIRRQDLAIQWLAHLITAIWWFQPLTWVIRRQLRAESELACDSEALRSGIRPSEYAHHLLALAKNFDPDKGFSSSAIGMIRSADLEARLHAILESSGDLAGPRRIFGVAIFLAAASLAASAVTLHSNQFDEPGGSMMKRTILSALLTSAGLSAATVSGYIHDANGAAIADAKVSLYNADNSTRQEAMTGPDGQFTLQNSAGGQFFLRIEKSGFTSIFRVVDLKTDTKLDRDLTITNEGTPAIRDSSLATSAAWPSLVRVGGRVAESNIIAKVAPIYPVAAKQAGVQGTVELDVVVSKEGVPEALQVITSPSDDLSQSALEAVRLWRYRPTLLNGNPVPIETSVIVNYTLTK